MRELKKRSVRIAPECHQKTGGVLDTAYGEAKKILQDHRDQLDLVAGELLKHETLDAPTFKRLIHQPRAA